MLAHGDLAHTRHDLPDGHEHILLNMEVWELRRRSRITPRMDGSRRLVRDGKKELILRCFSKVKVFMLLFKQHQRRARLVVSAAVFASSARMDTQLMLELQTAPLDNERRMALREREIVTRLGHDAQSSIRYQRCFCSNRLAFCC